MLRQYDCHDCHNTRTRVMQVDIYSMGFQNNSNQQGFEDDFGNMINGKQYGFLIYISCYEPITKIAQKLQNKYSMT